VAYDKDSIRKAQEKKIFGDTFDPMALGLSKEEKRRMVKELSAHKKDMTSEMLLAAERAEGAQQKQSGKNKKSEPGFFASLFRLLYMLFTGTRPSDYEKQKAIKTLRDAVRQIKPPVMTFSPDQVTGELARQIHSLYQYLAPLNALFEDTVANNNAESKFNFQLYFLMQALPFLDSGFETLFTENGLKEFIGSARDDAARTSVQEMIEALLHSAEEEDRKQVNRYFGDMLNFYDLMRFNFPGFLRLFCPGYSVHANNNVFGDVRADTITRELKSLEGLILSVHLEQMRVMISLVGNYFQLYLRDRMDEEYADGVTEHLLRIGLRNYHGLGFAISKLVGGQQLARIIRYSTRSYEHEPRVQAPVSNFFEEFTKNFKSVVNARLDRVITRRRREEVGMKMQELFGAAEPLKGYFYNDDTNAMLSRLELASFIYTTAFYVSMRFYTEKFPEHIKRSLNRLVVEGSYKDSLARRVLSEEFYRSEELCEKLEEFSESVNSQKERGILLYGMIQKFKGNLAAKKALNARIATVNEGLHPVLLEIHESSSNLQGVLLRIAADIGAHPPKVVDNLPKIGAHNNARFLIELRKSAQDYALFASLISETFREM
jgi:hypothetical protein